jgi:hypothetical protein
MVTRHAIAVTAFGVMFGFRDLHRQVAKVAKRDFWGCRVSTVELPEPVPSLTLNAEP